MWGKQGWWGRNAKRTGRLGSWHFFWLAVGLLFPLHSGLTAQPYVRTIELGRATHLDALGLIDGKPHVVIQSNGEIRIVQLDGSSATLRSRIFNPLSGDWGHMLTSLPDANGDGVRDIATYGRDSQITGDHTFYLLSGNLPPGSLVSGNDAAIYTIPFGRILPRFASHKPGSGEFLLTEFSSRSRRRDIASATVLHTVTGNSIANGGIWLEDLDGDSVPDYLTGGTSFSGSVPLYVISGADTVDGSASGRAILTLSDPATPGLGYAEDHNNIAAGIGDLDGDGYSEIAVGSRLYRIDPDGTNYGRVVVFDGATGAVLYRLEPDQTSTSGVYFGNNIVAVGDIDGDGLGDFVVSARGYADPTGGFGNGAVIGFSGVDGSEIFRTYGGPGQRLGDYELTSLGDLNFDGVVDLGVASFGSGSVWMSNLDFVTIDFEATVIQAGANTPNGPTDPDPVLGTVIRPGDRLTGSFVYDLKKNVDVVPANPVFGIYEDAAVSAEFEVEGLRVLIDRRSDPGTPGQNFLNIRDNAVFSSLPPSDQFTMRASNNSGSVLGGLQHIDLAFATRDTSVLTSDSLRVMPSATWEQLRRLAFSESTSSLSVSIQADIDSYVVKAQHGPLNNPPVADAGDDQFIECSEPFAGTAMLDGSGSFDPDGDPLTFQWSGPFPEGGGMVGGSAATVTLAWGGPHSILLNVTDDPGLSSSDQLLVTVQDTIAPAVSAEDLTLEAVSPLGAPFDALGHLSATDACDPSPSVDFAPDLAVYPLGSTTINTTVVDAGGNTALGSFVLSVVDTTPPETSIVSALDGAASPLTSGDVTLSSELSLSFSGSDLVGVAGFECNVDETGFAGCSSPLALNGLADGSHSVEVRALDTSGNTDSTPALFQWTITPYQLTLGPLATNLPRTNTRLPLQLTATLANTGRADIPATEILFFLDLDSNRVVDAGEPSVVQPVADLLVGTSQNIVATFSDPPAGDYLGVAMVDPLDLFLEADESDNRGSVPLSIALPDLTVAGLTAASSLTKACAGGGGNPDCPLYSVDVTATIDNLGLLDAANVQVAFQASSDGGVTFSSIGGPQSIAVTAGGSAQVSTILRNKASGNLVIRVLVDPGDLVSEVDETNNTSDFPITIP